MPVITAPAAYGFQVEQPRTHQPQRPRPRPIPPQSGRIHIETASVYRAAPRIARRAPGLGRLLRRMPGPRLTALGAGLFATVVMLVLGLLDEWLLSGDPVVYGVLFLLVSALCALWVRPSDLVTAPVSVPIAFTVGVVPISGGETGVGAQIMAVVTVLAIHAGWLYGGTLLAVLIVGVRKVAARVGRGRGL